MTMQPEGRAVCGAKLKNGNGHCRRVPNTGRSRCHVHGGATPRGLSSPHFKHGRYSTALPERLAATYEAALRDPELLDLRDEIALIDVRTTEMFGAAENIPVDWNEIRASMEQRRRLCETEQKRMLAMRQLLTTEQVMLIVTTLLSAVRVHVHDRETLGRISDDFAKTLDRPGLREGGITVPDDPDIDG
jgi:hypothetical protein